MIRGRFFSGQGQALPLHVGVTLAVALKQLCLHPSHVACNRSQPEEADQAREKEKCRSGGYEREVERVIVRVGYKADDRWRCGIAQQVSVQQPGTEVESNSRYEEDGDEERQAVNKESQQHQRRTEEKTKRCYEQAALGTPPLHIVCQPAANDGTDEPGADQDRARDDASTAHSKLEGVYEVRRQPE